MTGAPESSSEPWTPPAYKRVFDKENAQWPWVEARSFSLAEWPYLDGQWLGIHAASDGKVYFSVSSHAKEHHAEVFRYVAATDSIEHLGSLGEIVLPEDRDKAPQDKIHTEMFEDGDWIYAATTNGEFFDDLPYPGGYWIRIHMPSGRLERLARSSSGEGILAAGFDRKRGKLYGHTNRTGRLVVFDLETREERDLGFPWAGSDSDWPRGISLMVAPDGRVFGGRPPNCSFWEYDPDTDEIRQLDVSLPLPAEVEAGDKDAIRDYRQSGVHAAFWDAERQCFYFVRSFDEMLCRLFPGSEDMPVRVETVYPLRPDFLKKRFDSRPVACVLARHDDTIWYTPNTGWGGDAFLVNYKPAADEWGYQGNIILEEGRRVAEIHSLDAAADGRLYAVAFAYSIRGQDPVLKAAMRDKFPFHPRFVIIDPATDLRHPGEEEE